MIGIISIAVFTTLQFLLFEVSHTNSRSNILRAEQLAHSVAAIAANPVVPKYDPLLSGETDDGSFSARIVSEGSRLPLNQFIAVERRRVLETLFVFWGMDENQAGSLVDELIDWVDPDSRTTGTGKERPWYMGEGKPDYPFNRPFKTLNELELLDGFQALTNTKPDWQSYFTLRSSGKLDINSAGPELIAAVCGCSLPTAEHFIETRSGSDGIPHTEDDEVFETVEAALDILMTHGTDRERCAAVSFDGRLHPAYHRYRKGGGNLGRTNLGCAKQRAEPHSY